MKRFSLIVLLLLSSLAFAQTAVNDYEYVIVPTKFGFSNKKDEFRLNTLTKLLLEKYGFKAFLDSEPLPDAVAESNCKKLYADVESKGGFFTTKVRVILKDCKNKVLYTSDEGKSAEKDWGKAYNAAIRMAFESFASLGYKYKPRVAPSVVQQVSGSNAGNESAVLFAQPIANGFQLVDNTPKVVMQLYKTSDPNRFAAVKNEQHGDLIARNGQWFFEYFANDALVSELVNVKF